MLVSEISICIISNIHMAYIRALPSQNLGHLYAMIAAPAEGILYNHAVPSSGAEDGYNRVTIASYPPSLVLQSWQIKT